MLQRVFRRIFQPVTLPGWVAVLVGIIYVLDAFGIILDTWSRVESSWPGAAAVLIAWAPYLAIFAGFAWVVWATARTNPLEQKVARLARVKQQLRAYAHEAEQSEHKERATIDALMDRARRDGKNGDGRRAIMATYAPPDVWSWHEQVRGYIRENLGPVDEGVFHRAFKDIAQREMIKNQPERVPNYFRGQRNELVRIAGRLDLTDLY